MKWKCAAAASRPISGYKLATVTYYEHRFQLKLGGMRWAGGVVR